MQLPTTLHRSKHCHCTRAHETAAAIERLSSPLLARNVHRVPPSATALQHPIRLHGRLRYRHDNVPINKPQGSKEAPAPCVVSGPIVGSV